MATPEINKEDLQVIGQFNDSYRAIIDTLNRAMQFKVGDYLVLYLSAWGESPGGDMEIEKNTYGAPVKYKVVHATVEGICFVKRVNKKGTPIGRIYSCAGTEADTYRHMSQTFRFELDPDYADAILLEDEYDPSHLHRSKKEIWKSVTTHNKASRIKTGKLHEVVDLFKTVQVGDTLWTSTIGHYLIQDKKEMGPGDFNGKAKWSNRTNVKGPFVTILTVRDKNGKIREIAPDFFWGKALYRERPRSYKELNI
jgi:hypothetical protein